MDTLLEVKERIEATPNRSWRIDGDLARYFTGISLGDKMIASLRRVVLSSS